MYKLTRAQNTNQSHNKIVILVFITDNQISDPFILGRNNIEK
jgi:hypothetical protein